MRVVFLPHDGTQSTFHVPYRGGMLEVKPGVPLDVPDEIGELWLDPQRGNPNFHRAQEAPPAPTVQLVTSTLPEGLFETSHLEAPPFSEDPVEPFDASLDADEVAD